jgi:hypothetical protein
MADLVGLSFAIKPEGCTSTTRRRAAAKPFDVDDEFQF